MEPNRHNGNENNANNSSYGSHNSHTSPSPAFLKNGGLRESMTRARLQVRNHL